MEELRLRTALVVLNNCEHLVDACARLAEALLRVSNGKASPAVSRSRLSARSSAATGSAG
jgi:predicted ATPase